MFWWLPIIRLFLLLLYDCYYDNVMNFNYSFCTFQLSKLTPVKESFDHSKSHTHSENRCSRYWLKLVLLCPVSRHFAIQIWNHIKKHCLCPLINKIWTRDIAQTSKDQVVQGCELILSSENNFCLDVTSMGEMTKVVRKRKTRPGRLSLMEGLKGPYKLPSDHHICAIGCAHRHTHT